MTQSNSVKECHTAAKSESAVEVYLQNGCVPSVTVILMCQDEKQGEKEKQSLEIYLVPKKDWQTEIDENTLRFYLNEEKYKPNITPELNQKKRISTFADIHMGKGQPRVPIHVNGHSEMIEATLALEHERSFICENVVRQILDKAEIPKFKIKNQHIFGLDDPELGQRIVGRCMLKITISSKSIHHNVCIMSGTQNTFYLGNYFMHIMCMVLDFLNEKVWSRVGGATPEFEEKRQAYHCAQMMPYAIELQVKKDVTILAFTSQFTIALKYRKGKQIKDSDAFVCLIKQQELECEYTPLIETGDGIIQIVLDNKGTVFEEQLCSRIQSTYTNVDNA